LYFGKDDDKDVTDMKDFLKKYERNTDWIFIAEVTVLDTLVLRK
jgi:hypothetical protein